MKAILISIKPKWVVAILNGEKTIEVRKTMPKCDLPIDVYIYCTFPKKHNELLDKYLVSGEWKLWYGTYTPKNGKVVAKFTLNKVEEIMFYDKKVQKKACLTEDELFDYLFVNEPYHEDMKKGYAWHIDNLVIFDKPKELSEFYHYVKYNKEMARLNEQDWDFCKLTKAPQSWCYIEVKE